MNLLNTIQRRVSMWTKEILTFLNLLPNQMQQVKEEYSLQMLSGEKWQISLDDTIKFAIFFKFL